MFHYIETYSGYQIYSECPSRLHNCEYYIAVHPNKHHIIDGVDLPDLKGDIEEALR